MEEDLKRKGNIKLQIDDDDDIKNLILLHYRSIASSAKNSATGIAIFKFETSLDRMSQINFKGSIRR